MGMVDFLCQFVTPGENPVRHDCRWLHARHGGYSFSGKSTVLFKLNVRLKKY
jgi:hypothetical protein